MADITTYQNFFNLLKTKLEIDFGTGFEDQTRFLQSVNIQQDLSEISYGIRQTTAYFELILLVADVKWTKKGLPIKMTISITDDKGLTWFDYVIFEGKTSRKSTMSNLKVKIQAKDKLSELLAKKPATRTLLQNTTSSVLNSIVTSAWAGQGVVFSDVLNYPISVVQSDDTDLGTQLLEFAKLNHSVIIHESNLIKFISGFDVAMTNTYTNQGNLAFGKIHFGNYSQNIALSKNEYFNVFKAVGNTYKITNNIFTGTFSNIKISAQERVFLDELDLKGVLPSSVSGNSCVFRVADDDTSGASVATIESTSIIADDKILVVIKNNGVGDVYLRNMVISGVGLQPLGKITRTWENTGQIALDGEIIEFEINSKIAQNSGNLENLVNIQKNFSTEYFEFQKANWSPNYQAGCIFTTYNPKNELVYGLITNTNITISLTEGFVASCKFRKFVPNTTNWFNLNLDLLNNSSSPLI